MKNRNVLVGRRRTAAGVLLTALLGVTAVSASPRTRPLTDGLVIAGVEGTVTQDANDGPWRFALNAALVIGKIDVPAATSFVLLPGHALEVLTADAGRRSADAYRIWARVTYYRGNNYLYLVPSYFMPLAERGPQADAVPRDPNQGQAAGIPAEVLALMEQQQAMAGGPEGRRAVIPADALLLGRRGYLQRDGERPMFVLDGLGRKVSRERFVLLPSAVRERMERELDRHADRLDYRVSGIRTRYRGQAYLLLHQAVRLHGHGNLQ
jgi:hypothetical protein